MRPLRRAFRASDSSKNASKGPTGLCDVRKNHTSADFRLQFHADGQGMGSRWVRQALGERVWLLFDGYVSFIDTLDPVDAETFLKYRGCADRESLSSEVSVLGENTATHVAPVVTPMNPVLPLEGGTALVSEMLGRKIHDRHLIENKEDSGAYRQTRRWYILKSDALEYGETLLRKEAIEGRRYSVSEAAQVLGCTDKVVYARIADKSLAADKVRGRWSITQIAIDAHVQEAKDHQ